GYDYSLTLDHFRAVFHHRDLVPFVNSVKLAFFTALISSMAGVFLSYIIKRKNYSLRSFSDLLATIPMAVPGILLGIGYLVNFKYPVLGIGRYILTDSRPLILLGTGVIIYIICIFRYLNIGLRIGYALIEHINPDIEDAARNLGQRESAIYRKIVFPLIAPAFRNSFFRVFATTMTTLGAIIFLLLPSNKVAVQTIFQIITSSERGVAASMALMLSGLTIVLLGLFFLVNRLFEKLIK
ncbi:MAG: ABC transporter permease subunit, partial [Spirochaetales bacterium]|nr:ABC transporter permease subunit [Spirochaetales bacterium]